MYIKCVGSSGIYRCIYVAVEIVGGSTRVGHSI